MDRKTVDKVARDMLAEHQMRVAMDNVVNTCTHVRAGAPVAAGFARVATTDAPRASGEPLLVRLCADCLYKVHQLIWELERE